MSRPFDESVEKNARPDEKSTSMLQKLKVPGVTMKTVLNTGGVAKGAGKVA